METQIEIASNIDNSTVTNNSTQIETNPLPNVPKIRKKRISKRKTIKDPEDMQNIRLSVKVRTSDKMIELADKRGMATTLSLYRLYIEEGIEKDTKRLAEQEVINETVVREAIQMVMGNGSDS